MNTQLFRFTLYTIIAYLALSAPKPAGAASQPSGGNGIHFCGVTDDWWDRQHSDQFPDRRYARTFAANLNVGEPRTVRMIYFLPNDRPYRAEMVQGMKDVIVTVQRFFAEQMEAHGYGKVTFRIETDTQGEPMVHRVDGRHPDNYYLDNTHIVYEELKEMFNHEENIYLTAIDISTHAIDRGIAGTGRRVTKRGGQALVVDEVEEIMGGISDPWLGIFWGLVAHELGHAFGLGHDFNNGAYIMSYGPGVGTELSKCHAEYLSVHPYFNRDTPIEEGVAPQIELLSPRTYPPGSTSVPIQIQVNDSDGLHQVILHAAQPDHGMSVKACRGVRGRNRAVFEFDYDGVIPSAHYPLYSSNTSLLNPLVHPIVIEAVDMNGDSNWDGYFGFVLFSEALEPLRKISGDNLQGFPNTPLPVPFIVEVRDLNDVYVSHRHEVWVTFTVTVGGGSLSVERVKTDDAGRAESVLTLGPNFGTNTVEVSAEGFSVTFNAVAGAAADIPDVNLRAAIVESFGKAPGTPIAPAEITTMTFLHAPNANINDLTGLEGATNLIDLRLSHNAITDISPLAGLTNLDVLEIDDNNISDISAVAGMTNLRFLSLQDNSISDISAVAGLIHLRDLRLSDNKISDLSPLVANTGGGNFVQVRRNPLSYQSIYTDIPTLNERGVFVRFDIRTPTTLLKISGVITKSDNVLTVEVRDSNGRIFEGVPVTFTVTSGGGTLSATNTTTDENGRAQSTLTLGKESNRVTVSAVGTEQTVTFSDVAEDGVHIPDPNLRAAIGAALGLTPGDPISMEEMVALTHFNARDWTEGASISLLTGLEFATNLTQLRLGNNSITDVSPLSGLTNLTTLGLGRNSVTDISPLSGLTNLRTLGLSNNGIKDVSALVEVLSGLTNLTNLHLTGNHITDISFLSELTGLTELRLSGNNITDISPLSRLTNLRTLHLPSGITDVPVIVRILSRLPHLTSLGLSNSNIEDESALIPVLSDLTDLRDLNLSRNRITDLSPLAELTNLTSLNLWGNNISDISPLLENTGLGSGGWGWVGVGGNPLSYQSIHTHIPTLQSRGVTVDFDNQAHPALLKISGDNQRRTPGKTLVNPFVVEAQDENGLVLAGISVTFTVTSGDGTLSIQSTTTNANGRAQSTLTLGPYLGTHTVLVSAVEIEVPVTFNAEGIRIPKTLEIISGKDQEGLPGDALEKAFVVEVRDQTDNPLPGVEVTFTVTAGGGTVQPEIATTDENGRAESILTLGPNPGTNTVTVSVTGSHETRTFNAEGIRIPKKLEIVSGKDQEGLPGEALEKAFVVEVRDQTDKPLPGVEVPFTVTAGGGTVQPEIATTDENGRAESILTLGPNPGTNTVIVSITGSQETRTFNAEGSRIPKTLEIISGIDQEGLPGTTLEKPFVVEVRDQTDKPLPGAQVTFTVTSGDGTLSEISVTTDSNGRAESTLTLGPNPGTNTVTVSVTGSQETRTFNAEGVRIPKKLEIISGVDQAGLPGDALEKPFVVEVRDQTDKPLPGAQVTFTVTSGDGTLSEISVTTDSNGRAESTLTLGPNPGTNTVTVSVTGSQETRTFNAEGVRIPKKLEIISGVDQAGLPGDALEKPFVVEVRDQTDTPLAGVEVPFTVTAGGGTVQPEIATTDENGRAESILTLGPNPGTNTVTVSVTGSHETRTFNAEGIRIPKKLEIVSGKDQEGLPGEALEKAFVVEVRDQTDKPLPGVEVPFTVTAGGGTVQPEIATTDENGRAESILTLGPNPGTNTVIVSITGSQETRTFNAEGSRIPKTLEIISGIDQEGLPGTTLEKPFVVEVRDQTDKPLPGAQVTFTVTSGDGTLSEISVTTDSNGRAESTLTLGPNPGTNTVTVSVTGSQETRTFNAEGVRIPKKLEIISGVDQAGLPGDALEKPFVVEVRDQTDKPLPGAQVTFTVTSGDGTLSEISVTTDSNGRAESTLTLGPNPGTNTVTVSVTGSQETRTFNAEGVRIPKKLEIISGVDQAGLPGEALEKAFVVEVRDQTDKPLPGVEVTFTVTAGGGTVQPEIATTDENGRAESTLTLGSTPGTNTVRVSVEGNTHAVAILTIEAVKIPMFTLSIPAGTHLIHIPLAVNQINGEDGTIETVGDVYAALGDAVRFIITLGADGNWISYLGDMSAGTMTDAEIGDDTGLIAVMKSAATLELVGDALGTGGVSQINIGIGNNLVGVPLDPAVDMMISDALVEGVEAIAVSNAAGDGFNTISAAGQDGDGPIMGGVGYIVVATAEASIPVIGSAWENEGAAMAAPGVAFSGSQTPVLHVDGGIMDEFNMLSRIPELRVTVKNLSTGASLDTVLGTELSATAYSATFVEFGRHAAKAGDVLEIVAHAPNPFVGVRPVPQIVVSAEEVLTSRISLPDLELYEIPSETELLANYPNPFNPETWIPYRLAKAAGVTLDIYDATGRLVRTIDVGFKPAAVYESRASAIYWDGRNDYGEQAASGVYFYHLSAGTYSATRKMLIMK